jgi:hypothetical protein
MPSPIRRDLIELGGTQVYPELGGTQLSADEEESQYLSCHGGYNQLVRSTITLYQ